MVYIYSIWITTNSQEDVNKKLLENELKGEVISDLSGGLYICPQITDLWHEYPKSYRLESYSDPRWNRVIASTLKFMQENYSVRVIDPRPQWRAIMSPFRCPEMKQYAEKREQLSFRTL